VSAAILVPAFFAFFLGEADRIDEEPRNVSRLRKVLSVLAAMVGFFVVVLSVPGVAILISHMREAQCRERYPEWLDFYYPSCELNRSGIVEDIARKHAWERSSKVEWIPATCAEGASYQSTAEGVWNCKTGDLVIGR